MAKTWHVSFDLTVSAAWIDDGFDLTPALLEEIMKDGILDYAYDEEKKIEHIRIKEKPYADR